MKGFYQEIITQKSWQILRELKKEIDFMLIGGWAVYLYNEALKSKDIDIIVAYDTLSYLKGKYELGKNDRLKKYEMKKEDVDIDVYLPYYSNLGLKAEEILEHKERLAGFVVPRKEILLATKQKAYFERKGTIKGEKDKIDIISLILIDDFDFKFYKNILKEFKLGSCIQILREILEETKEVKELNLNKHYFAKKKKRILERI